MQASENTPANVSSPADPIVIEELKKYFFEPGVFAKHLTDLGFDVAKLRQMNKEIVNKAEDILIRLIVKIREAEKSENQTNHDENYKNVQALGAEFYATIPHLPTANQIPLDREDNTNSKLSLLKSLRYILDALDLLTSIKATQNFLQDLYSNLKYTISPLEQTAANYEIIKNYGETNAISSNSTIQLVVRNILSCTPKDEANKKDLSNKTLLWYGDRASCYSGILSKEFQYKDKMLEGGEPSFSFSDSVIKSMSSCYLDRYNKDAYLLLCEVALGNTLKVDSIEQLQQTEAKTFDSVLVVGKMSPTPGTETKLGENVDVPIGKLEALNQEAKTLYNNFLVYDPSQIKLRYIVKFDIKYL